MVYFCHTSRFIVDAYLWITFGAKIWVVSFVTLTFDAEVWVTFLRLSMVVTFGVFVGYF